MIIKKITRFLTALASKISNRRFAQLMITSLATLILSGCHHNLGILNPKGLVAHQEQLLLLDSIALMLIVVIPVIIMSFAFSVRYRAKHDNTAKYRPNWSHNAWLEAIWWGIPLVIIVALGIMCWKSSHKLDPYRKLDVPGKPLLIEAVALRWKWLFIYPKQNIATINYIEIPKNRQVEFWITADAPMSAFFIPQLGSQIYAMAGMRTRLHLIADENGTYAGLNTQYNGAGFSDMHFKAKVTDKKDFKRWVNVVRKSNTTLSIEQYKKIVKPTIAAPVELFNSVHKKLFERIMMQYMMPNMRLH